MRALIYASYASFENSRFPNIRKVVYVTKMSRLLLQTACGTKLPDKSNQKQIGVEFPKNDEGEVSKHICKNQQKHKQLLKYL